MTEHVMGIAAAQQRAEAQARATEAIKDMRRLVTELAAHFDGIPLNDAILALAVEITAVMARTGFRGTVGMAGVCAAMALEAHRGPNSS